MFGTNINRKGKKEKNKTVLEGTCIFPFKYKWKKHDVCFETEKGPICATSVSKHGTLKTYGYCPHSKNKTRKRQLISKTKIEKQHKNIQPNKPVKVRTMKLKKLTSTAKSPQKSATMNN